MHGVFGRAAFLASLVLLWALAAGPSIANGSRPIYACFASQNAAAIGRLGASDPSVRHGFETGECLALPPGVSISDLARQGSLWRFRVFGAQPHLFAADWAAGFRDTTEPAPPGFEQYLPVTARLLASGRNFAECYDASEKLAARIADHDRRWRQYQNQSRTKPDGSTPVVVIYVGDTGPKLVAEAEQLRRQSRAHDERCGSYAALEVDEDFIAFVRTAQRT